MFIKPATFSLIFGVAISLISYTNSHPTPQGVSQDDLQSIEELDLITDASDINADVFNTLKDVMQKVSAASDQAELNIEKMRKLARKIQQEHFNNTGKILDKFNNGELSLVRQNLQKLGEKTVAAVADIKDIIEAWNEDDEDATIYVEAQYDIMKTLVKESLVILEDSIKKYNVIIKTFEGDLPGLREFGNTVYKMSEEGTEEFEEWSEFLRKGAYGGAAGGTAACAIADASGALGICSAIYNLIVWPITIAAVETEIAEYREALEETSGALNAIVESIDSIEKTLKVANKKLEEEVSLVITWQAKAQSTDRTLQRWSVDQLQQKQGLQKLVLKSLTKLGVAAQAYLDYNKVYLKQQAGGITFTYEN